MPLDHMDINPFEAVRSLIRLSAMSVQNTKIKNQKEGNKPESDIHEDVGVIFEELARPRVFGRGASGARGSHDASTIKRQLRGL